MRWFLWWVTSSLNFSLPSRRHWSQMKVSSLSEEIWYQSLRWNFSGEKELFVGGTWREKYRYPNGDPDVPRERGSTKWNVDVGASSTARLDSQEKARDNLLSMMVDRGLHKYFLMTYRLLSFLLFSRKLTSSCAIRCSSRVRCACARSCWSSSSFTSFSSRITCICLPSSVAYNSWIASVFAAICLLIWIYDHYH